MNTVTPKTVRARMRRRAAKIREDIDQYFRDVAHWNRTHPDLPIDPDPDGRMARASEWIDRMLEKLK